MSPPFSKYLVAKVWRKRWGFKRGIFALRFSLRNRSFTASCFRGIQASVTNKGVRSGKGGRREHYRRRAFLLCNPIGTMRCLFTLPTTIIFHSGICLMPGSSVST